MSGTKLLKLMKVIETRLKPHPRYGPFGESIKFVRIRDGWDCWLDLDKSEHGATTWNESGATLTEALTNVLAHLPKA